MPDTFVAVTKSSSSSAVKLAIQNPSITLNYVKKTDVIRITITGRVPGNVITDKNKQPYLYYSGRSDDKLTYFYTLKGYTTFNLLGQPGFKPITINAEDQVSSACNEVYIYTDGDYGVKLDRDQTTVYPPAASDAGSTSPVIVDVSPAPGPVVVAKDTKVPFARNKTGDVYAPVPAGATVELVKPYNTQNIQLVDASMSGDKLVWTFRWTSAFIAANPKTPLKELVSVSTNVAGKSYIAKIELVEP